MLLAARSAIAAAGSIVVVVGVAAALTDAFKALQRGLDLLPVTPAAHPDGGLARRLLQLDGGPYAAVGPLTDGMPPAQPAPPGILPSLRLVVGGGVLSGWAGSPAASSQTAARLNVPSSSPSG